jgi:hypothetical protein
VVRRLAPVLIVATAWLAWTARASDLGAGAERASLVLVAAPLAAAAAVLVALAVADDVRLAALAAIVAAAAAVATTALDLPTAAGLAKIVAAASLGLVLAHGLERPWQIGLVALLVIGVDSWSVFAGLTKQLLEGPQERIDWLTVPFTVPGRYNVGGVGVTDLLFLGLFTATARRFHLRLRSTVLSCAASLSVTVLLAVALDRALPALPLMAIAFLAANADRLWRHHAEPPADLATMANARRNASGRRDRGRRWRPARDACWSLLDPLVPAGAAVAVVGAGNCDDLPLTRLAERAGRIDLVDVDPAASSAAAAREGRALRQRIRVLEGDATGGAADRIMAAVLAGEEAAVPDPDWAPLGEPPYGVVIADLFYSQLLYPALLDRRLDDARIGDVLRRYGQALTAIAVSRLHASAAGGVVVHLDDPVAWWQGHEQPFAIDEVLRRAAASDAAALALIATANRPTGSDPRLSLAALGIPILETCFWRWPFGPGVEYLVCATVAGAQSR